MILLCSAAFAQDTAKNESKSPVVVIKTSLGLIEVQLNPEKAPVTVENFLSYVNESFYDSTLIERAIPDFLIQGGGFTVNMVQLATKAPITNEAANGLKNLRGTIAMARALDPHSATCLFYINLKDNASFDHKNDSKRGFGYAVFGEVLEGMDVADAIAQVKTKRVANVSEAFPLELVVIESIRLKKSAE